MLTEQPTLADLFAQLGLPNDEQQISRFIDAHRPLDNAVKLQDAPFWNQAQASFLCDALDEDAEWAELIDQLNQALR